MESGTHLMIRVLRIFAIAAVLAAALVSAASLKARADGGDESMIQIGAGGASGGKTIEALFRVDGSYKLSIDGDRKAPYLIVARIKADVTAGGGSVPYIDLEFETLGYEIGSEDRFSKEYFSVSLVGLDLQRDLAVNNDLTYRVSFLGIKAGVEGFIRDDVRIMLRGALDLLGLAFSERASDGSATSAAGGYGATGEFGIEFREKYRIVLGEKFGATYSDGVNYVDGIECQTYYENYDHGQYGHGYASTYCRDRIVTEYLQHRYTSKTYLNLIADLTRNLQAFGQVAFNVYKVRDRRGQVSRSTDSALQFKLGVAYRF